MQSREQLELRKLELEVEALARPRWLRVEYLVPSVIAVVTFLAVCYTGYFDQERARLKRETDQMKVEKEILQHETAQLKANLNRLKTAIEGIPLPETSGSPASSPGE